jgi:hypothetical protein
LKKKRTKRKERNQKKRKIERKERDLDKEKKEIILLQKRRRCILSPYQIPHKLIFEKGVDAR